MDCAGTRQEPVQHWQSRSGSKRPYQSKYQSQAPIHMFVAIMDIYVIFIPISLNFIQVSIDLNNGTSPDTWRSIVQSSGGKYYAHIHTLLAKKVVTPPLKTIKPMWIELLCFRLAEIGMIWTRECSPTKSDTTLGRHSMQGQVGSSSSETTV